MNTTKQQDKGFTIIEVVLVLAIAALIFLMVFIALPALQRNQANGARKNDVGVIVSAVGTYRTNNSGGMPTESNFNTQMGKYLDGGLARLDPEITVSTGETTVDETDTGSLDKVFVALSAQCDAADSGHPIDAGSRQAAVVTLLEVTSGEYEAYCQNT